VPELKAWVQKFVKGAILTFHDEIGSLDLTEREIGEIETSLCSDVRHGDFVRVAGEAKHPPLQWSQEHGWASMVLRDADAMIQPTT
jgi:hypothetical protein